MSAKNITIIFITLSIQNLYNAVFAGGELAHDVSKYYKKAEKVIKKTQEFQENWRFAIFQTDNAPELLYYSTQIVNGVNHVMVYSFQVSDLLVPFIQVSPAKKC